MTAKRKTAEARELDLKLAIHRIEQGRAHTKATVVNVTTVAKEAGVSTSLIYNHYPEFAESIRTKQGKASRVQRDAKMLELKKVKTDLKKLRDELKTANANASRLVSLNEMLLAELDVLRAQVTGANVSRLQARGEKKR